MLLVFFYAIDFQHYDYLHQRLNASVLNYTEDAKISFGMVWQTYPVVKIIFIILIVIIILLWLINRSFKKIKLSSRNIYPPRWLHFFFLFLVLAFFIFGRAGQYPLRWSDAFRFGDDFKASLSLNPIQSFSSTLQFRHSTYEEKKVRNYYGLLSKYLQIKNADSANLNYIRSYQFESADIVKPNVVLVICESFSAYKSSMWGNPLNTTPFILSISPSHNG